MATKTFRALVLVALTGLVLAIGAGVQAASEQDESAGTPVPLSLPVSENPAAKEFKEGEGRDLVMANCLKCHTANPIVTHDGFSPDMWASEVQKMRETYGADITAADAQGIVDYLAAIPSADPDTAADTPLAGVEPICPATPVSSPEATPALSE